MGMQVIARRSYCPKPIATILVYAIMALVAEHYTVVNRRKPGVFGFSGGSTLIGNYVVTVFNKIGQVISTACTEAKLSESGLRKSGLVEFERTAHYAFLFSAELQKNYMSGANTRVKQSREAASA